MWWCKICHSHPHLADKTGVFQTGSNNSFIHSIIHYLLNEKSKGHMNKAWATAKKTSWLSKAEKSSCPLAYNGEEKTRFSVFLPTCPEAKHTHTSFVLLCWEYGFIAMAGSDNRGAYHSHEGKTQIVRSIAQTIIIEWGAQLQSAEFWRQICDKLSRRLFIVPVSNNREF